MKVYREVMVNGYNYSIVWAGSQMYGSKESVLEAINKRAEESKRLFGHRIEKYNLHPWDTYEMKEGETTAFLTVERKLEVIDDENKKSIILGFVTYEVK